MKNVFFNTDVFNAYDNIQYTLVQKLLCKSYEYLRENDEVKCKKVNNYYNCTLINMLMLIYKRLF